MTIKPLIIHLELSGLKKPRLKFSQHVFNFAVFTVTCLEFFSFSNVHLEVNHFKITSHRRKILTKNDKKIVYHKDSQKQKVQTLALRVRRSIRIGRRLSRILLENGICPSVLSVTICTWHKPSLTCGHLCRSLPRVHCHFDRGDYFIHACKKRFPQNMTQKQIRKKKERKKYTEACKHETTFRTLNLILCRLFLLLLLLLFHFIL